MYPLPRALLLLAPVLLIACPTPARPRGPEPRPAARAPSGDRCAWAWRRLELCRVTPASLPALIDQRRAFLDRAEEALHLAERARVTFRALGLEDEAARAAGAHALALSYLGREEEALTEFRGALPALAEAGRWHAYVSFLNGVGVCLLRLGRAHEARREYALALRQVNREARPAVHAFVRANLARALFEGGRYEEAVRAFGSAAAMFEAQGAVADQLSMELYRVEALARVGNGQAARALLMTLRQMVREQNAIDGDVLSSLAEVLSGEKPDFDLLGVLRVRAESQIEERLRRAV